MEKGAEKYSLFSLLGWDNDLLPLLDEIVNCFIDKLMQIPLARIVRYIFLLDFTA